MGEAVVGGEAVASGVDPAGDVSEAIARPFGVTQGAGEALR